MHFLPAISAFCALWICESSRELERRSESWRPWRAYATMYLWTTAGDRDLGKNKVVRFNREKTNGTTPHRLSMVV